MKFRATSYAFAVTAAFFAALCAAPGAQAFTIENQAGPSGGQGFTDRDAPAGVPDRHVPVSPFNDNTGQTTVKQGNTTFQFGQQRPFNERYSTDNIFNPYTREGR
ncbi:MAG TPA: hypothetical protein VEH02_08040 [Pseudolabrys sp.]|nr:hypothetical protein [Pseudolabrys sp.]